MSHKSFFFTLGHDPLSISRREKIVVAFAGLVSVLLAGLMTQHLMLHPSPILIASMGASAAILFVMPGSPVAQPWSLLGGHLCSAWIGVTLSHLIPDMVTSAAMATGLSIITMLLVRCFHPPGAATALAPILNHSPGQLFDIQYLAVPVGINVILMLSFTILINRYLLKKQYPISNSQFLAKKPKIAHQPNKLSDFYKDDIQQAIQDFDSFLDISYEDLSELFTQIQLNSFKRNHAPLTCASIMKRDVMTAAYDSDVEWAWQIMQQQQVKALPVLDKSKHVIGIVTPYDFLKYVALTPYANFQEKFLTFIRKTPDIHTNKPEAIGHIMTRKVATLPDSAPISELLQFMVHDGYRHIPIVDQQQRFIGMIYQRDFIAVLFHSKTVYITENQ